MCACTDIFVKPSIPQAHGGAHSTECKDLRSKAFCGVLYHETKMCACTDIFVKPSIPQAHGSTPGTECKDLRSKAFCGVL